MKTLSVVEISSILMSRSTARSCEQIPHRHWDAAKQASIVILWGLLIYPLLDPDLKQRKSEISVDLLCHLFKEYLGEKKECTETMILLKHYDYIRLTDDQRIRPGTRLFVAVDAAKMYALFRSSVIARKMYKELIQS